MQFSISIIMNSAPFEYTGTIEKIHIYLSPKEVSVEKAIRKAFLDD